VHRTCGGPNEIKKNPKPKNITRSFYRGQAKMRDRRIKERSDVWYTLCLQSRVDPLLDAVKHVVFRQALYCAEKEATERVEDELMRKRREAAQLAVALINEEETEAKEKTKKKKKKNKKATSPHKGQGQAAEGSAGSYAGAAGGGLQGSAAEREQGAEVMSAAARIQKLEFDAAATIQAVYRGHVARKALVAVQHRARFEGLWAPCLAAIKDVGIKDVSWDDVRLPEQPEKCDDADLGLGPGLGLAGLELTPAQWNERGRRIMLTASPGARQLGEASVCFKKGGNVVLEAKAQASLIAVQMDAMVSDATEVTPTLEEQVAECVASCIKTGMIQMALEVCTALLAVPGYTPDLLQSEVLEPIVEAL